MARINDVDLGEVETSILQYFAEESAGRSHTQDIADHIGITRHTAAKYLSVLEAKGILGVETVGNAKVWYSISDDVEVRSLRSDDLEEVTAIAGELLDLDDEDPQEILTNIQAELQRQLDNGGRYCIGARTDDQLVGFIIGNERSWEFGSPVRVGWIRILGVDPAYQESGIGRRLGDELLDRFDAAGVERVRTIVGWEESNLLPFFHSLGFGMSESTVLEKDITTETKS